jgi:hypothetical protein
MCKKLVQVFDALKMPVDMFNELCEFFEASNNSYHRWYPHDSWDYPKIELKTLVNLWLREHEMVEDVDDKYFYVLIHISW